MMCDISEEIIIRAAQREEEAFELIYRSFSKYVYNVTLNIVNSTEDAQEVTQEVFLTMYQKLDQFEFKSSLKTWIHRITINKALKNLSKNKKFFYRTTQYDEEQHSSKKGEVLKEKMNQEHNENLVSQLLSALTPDQKTCVVLRNIEGLSYQEIADTLMINVNTVRSRLSRARETLLAKSKGVIKNEL